MEAPKPGTYTGIPAEEYHAWKAANYSTLKRFKQSAAHAREIMVNPPVQTDSMALGTRVGEALLEPGVFANGYIVAADVGDRRFKEAKAKYKAFQEEAGDKTILTTVEMHKTKMMRDSIANHPLVQEIMAGDGVAEMSFVWEDSATGVLCKGRTDWYGSLWGNHVACDLKTTKLCSPGGWPREIANFQYHVQAAFYLDGLNAVSADERHWLWWCVENTSPFLSAVYQADPMVIEEGRRVYRAYLRAWLTCQETGVWAGYPEGLSIVDIPHWAYTSDEDLGIV
jgi:hypothetical protein